jgi:DNA-binding MarR family transcriptional regulator
VDTPPGSRTADDVPSAAEFEEAARLRSALRGFLRRGEQVARQHRLTPQRYLLMLMIHGAPDGSRRVTLSELAERLALAQSTVTELVDRAEDAGLVARVGSETDGRVVYVELTDEGVRRIAPVTAGLRAEREALRAVVASTDAAR